MIFQSTRPSRASTHYAIPMIDVRRFQSTRPSRASTGKVNQQQIEQVFQSTRPSRASTTQKTNYLLVLHISIHKALAGLDGKKLENRDNVKDFNPQGPRGPRHYWRICFVFRRCISIHKALAGLDLSRTWNPV